MCDAQGTWEHGNRQGQCRIEKNSNGVAFIDGNYQDNKMNGKVYMDPIYADHPPILPFVPRLW